MKKLILSLFVLVALTVTTNNAMAQFAIPSYDVPIIADPTTFEEIPLMNLQTITPFIKVNPFSQKPPSDGEMLLIVSTRDADVSTTSWVNFEIYSLDGSITYGPYTVYEGYQFSKALSDSNIWGVRTLVASSKSELSVWC